MVIILLWLIWGLIIAGSEAFKTGFSAMNSVLIRDWLMTPDVNSQLLKIWFIGICLLMTLLGVNLIFCSWEKIYKIIKVKFSGPKFYMLIVHAFFGLVALFHFGGFMLGFEQNDISLGGGMSCKFKNGYEVKINDINFTGNLAILDKSYRNIKKEDLDYKTSFAEVTLSQNGRELRKENIYYFQPLKYRDIRITLKSFISPVGANQGQINATTTPWIKLTATKNPVLNAFLIIYPLMILGILIHLILTWKTPAINRTVQEAKDSN